MKKTSLLEVLAWLIPLLATLAIGSHAYALRPDEAVDKLARARDELRAINTALLMERPAGQPMPDTASGLPALVADGTLPHIPLDPWGHAYQYRHPGKERAYELFSFGPDGVESKDDVVAWNLYGGR